VGINLKMVDADGDVLIDSSKEAVCNGGSKEQDRGGEFPFAARVFSGIPR
jgi:hypothetical protein